jgi:hypothetical protein
MNKVIWQLSLIVSWTAIQFGTVRNSAAQPPALQAWEDFSSQPLTIPTALLRACCDDYCRKPQPCISGVCTPWCPHTYCRKPCPSLPFFSIHTERDCFCRKPLPDVCRPLAVDHFTCAAGNYHRTAGGGQPSQASCHCKRAPVARAK